MSYSRMLDLKLHSVINVYARRMGALMRAQSYYLEQEKLQVRSNERRQNKRLSIQIL